jgi:hypothetical protein
VKLVGADPKRLCICRTREIVTSGLGIGGIGSYLR